MERLPEAEADVIELCRDLIRIDTSNWGDSPQTVGEAEAAEYCAARIREAGIGRVIVTLGSKGALLSGPEGTVHVPAVEVDTVDSTGAGDAFIGSFATCLAEGLGEVEAIRRANLYAALSTTKVGTQKSFCDRAAFERAWQAR